MGQVNPKFVYISYEKIYFVDKSIQNIIGLILKTTAVVVEGVHAFFRANGRHRNMKRTTAKHSNGEYEDWLLRWSSSQT